jgi:putative membrane protein
MPFGIGPPPPEAGRGGGEGVRTRDHLANVRTFLAWVRVGLALIGLAYVVDKFDLLESHVRHQLPVVTHPETRVLAVIILGMGGIVCLGAFVRFLVARRLIEREGFSPRVRMDVALAVLAVVAGVLFVGYLVHVGG